MVGKAKVLAVVPARGGSKGVHRKNLFELDGHPLVAYGIASAMASNSVDRIILSTEDPEIAEVGEFYGAEVPFLRPQDLAQDDTPDLPVFKHALSYLAESENYFPDIVVHLRPTSPLRPKGVIDQGVGLILDDPSVDCVRSVTESPCSPYKMWSLDANRTLQSLLRCELQEAHDLPRQMLPEVFLQSGHLDVIRTSTISKNSMSGTSLVPVFIDRQFCVDIDTDVDLRLLETFYSKVCENIDVPVLSRD